MAHRVRLDAEQLELVISALRARMAGVGADRANTIFRLLQRLEEQTPGNPNWIHGQRLTRTVE